MKKILLNVIVLIISMPLFSQVNSHKPNLDTGVYKSWPYLDNPILNRTGDHAMYSIKNMLNDIDTLMVWYPKGKKSKTVKDYRGQQFIGPYMVFYQILDTVFLWNYDVDTVYRLFNVADCQQYFSNGDYYLIFRNSTNTGDLKIRNVSNGIENTILNVTDYSVVPNKNIIVFTKENEETNNFELGLYEFSKKKIRTIYEANSIFQYIFSNDLSRLCILLKDSDGNGDEISIYNLGADLLNEPFADSSIIRTRNVKELTNISKDGSKLFYRGADTTFNGPDNIKSDIEQEGAKVSIFDYKSETEVGRNHLTAFNPMYALNIANVSTVQINSRIDKIEESLLTNNDWGIGYRESHNKEVKGVSNLLVNLNTGEKILMPYNFQISPDEKFAVYFDEMEKDYYSYEIKTKTRINLTEFIGTCWKGTEDNDADAATAYSARGIAGWLPNSNSVLIYDQYDIWEFDLMSRRSPKCLTELKGKASKTVFTILYDNEKAMHITKSVKSLLLVSFNKVNKLNGFYKAILQKVPLLVKLNEDSCLYWNPTAIIGNKIGMKPVKAETKGIYIVQRMRADQSPNYFITGDFKKFVAISRTYPEENYNWYKTELHQWTTSDSVLLSGILYKPENFDPTKKYPMIFFYYRKLSDNLNAYIRPEFSDCKLNIPWYVSNGYLVFTPDIFYRLGYTGESALKSVESAARSLIKFSFVDSKKLGLQGASFGGFETNYIVTHSRMFAAACSAVGLSDIVSAYNSLTNGVVKQSQFEFGGPYQIGHTLWERPQLYIDNSPVFNADRVTTPLLIMNSTYDSTIPNWNAFELFLALKKLGKKCWFLKYDKWNHGVWGMEGVDFDRRMCQFFDHFLKDYPAPKWMTRGALGVTGFEEESVILP